MHFASRRNGAAAEIISGVWDWRVWSRLGWAEIRRRYRRTAIGPFWTSLSLAVFIGTMGILYATLWKQDPHSYLPFLASGMIAWALVSAVLTEGCSVFTSAQGVITQLPFNYVVLCCSMVWRNVVAFLHNLAVYSVVAVALGTDIGGATLLLLPGLILTTCNGLWIAILLGMVCARFRDVQQVVTSVLQVAMFVTPVFFHPNQLGSRASVLADINPLYHLIEVIRAPLLGHVPSPVTYIYLMVMLVLGWSATLMLFSKYRSRIVFWL